MRAGKLIAAGLLVWAASLGLVWPTLQDSVSPVVHGAERPVQDARRRDDDDDRGVDEALTQVLRASGFTGTIESQLEPRLGRKLDRNLIELGRLLWFDTAHSLHQDNTCAGCHSPSNGFGDTQSIAIGVDNNGLVGPNRTGPRNLRRSPMVINTAFFPRLMWNGRFSAPGPGGALGDPFKNTFGFTFPLPEGQTKFPANDPIIKHLLHAQAFIPPTELVEVAGFTGVGDSLGPHFVQFDNGRGQQVPPAGASGFRNDPIRAQVLETLNGISAYRNLFGKVFPSVRAGGPIDFNMFGLAIAEFEFSLTFANAPIDQFARGRKQAMTAAEKRGALVFFKQGNCVTCHAVKGNANEMFSDFENHVVGIPQIAPFFGVGHSNMIYDGPGADEDFGLEQITGDPDDRYKFRTAPLRNIALAPAFFHNGSFTRLEDAIRYHLNPAMLGPLYKAKRAGIDRDLIKRLGPIGPVLARLDPEMGNGIALTPSETKDLIQFVTTGLLDPRATQAQLCNLVPPAVPSRAKVLEFEACNRR